MGQVLASLDRARVGVRVFMVMGALAVATQLPGCGADTSAISGTGLAGEDDADGSVNLADGTGDAAPDLASQDLLGSDGAGDVPTDAPGDATSCAGLSCDDGDPCTQDECGSAGLCVHLPATGTCTDGNACTTADHCVAGKCVGDPTNCDDKDTCTTDSCDQKTGCAHLPLDGTPCDDGDGCTLNDLCHAGVCGTGLPPTCDDKNSCTDDTCDLKTGCSFVNNVKPCSDGNPCTEGDTCGGGACLPGAASTSCDDLDPCTVDLCDAVTGCVHTAAATGTVCAGSVCEAGAFTAPSVCIGGQCVLGAQTKCNDGNVCTDDACDLALGCTHTSNVAFCEDGSACTKNDFCLDGVCQPGTKVDCNDGKVCTNDSCDPASGCVSTNVANGLVCVAASCGDMTFDPGSTCQDGNCALAGTPTSCDDSNLCTDDGCLPALGCVHAPNAATCTDGNVCTTADACLGGTCSGGTAITCNDNNPCTDDACDTALGCQFKPNSAKCDDGSICTTNDTCANSVCEPGVLTVCNDNNPCTDEYCDAQKGCVTTYNTNPCDDLNACTVSDTCDGKGACIGVIQGVDCNDGNACTIDSCDTGGGCTHTNAADGVTCIAASCGANGYTGPATCAIGICGAEPTPTTCDDAQICTTDLCNALQGCLHANNTVGCDDGNACTTSDTCTAGACAGIGTNCDDSNPCTDDSCTAATGCAHTPNTAVCTDNNPCTQNDLCGNGTCTGVASVNCDDKNPCTTDACDPFGGCTHTNNGLGCSDANACTSGDVCSGGTCVGSTAIGCDDQNVCTTDSCDAIAGCVHTNNSATCNDGSACTTNDTCSGGTCVGGAAPNCNDGNACTDDSCTPAGGCAHNFNTAPCNDGNACTTADACSVGGCVGGAALVCNDGNPCTSDSCDSTKGCVSSPNAGLCSDGNACTTGDFCANSLCQSGTSANCNDNNMCTDDSCNPLIGCVNTPNSLGCNDGNACTNNDVCANGKCAGTGNTCDDGNACTSDTCDSTGGCIHTALSDGSICISPTCVGNAWQGSASCSAGVCATPPAAVSCDDANVCTTDACNAVQGCLHANNSAACDDNNACTTGDTCQSGACAGTLKSCNDNNVCTDDSCNSATGCVNAANTSVCSDGNACTTNDVCANSVCTGPTAVTCNDNNPCTTDTCDPIAGCIFTANTLACGDGSACTTNDTCANSKCVGGAAPVCNDGNVCTNDSCDPASGCLHAANNALCDDGNACTTGDVCANSACQAGTGTLNCNDNNACTTDTCDATLGCQHVTAADGTVCGTASCATLIYAPASTCLAGVCTAGTSKSCDDGIECTTDACDATSGCSSTTKPWGTTCTTGAAAQKYQFCAATLCTGVEENAGALSNNMTTGILTSLDRYPSLSINASGYDLNFGGGGGGGGQTGLIRTVVESPLGLSANSAVNNLGYTDMRRRLTVGGVITGGDSTPSTLLLNTAAGTWAPGGPTLNGLTRALRAVDMAIAASGTEVYLFGGNAAPATGGGGGGPGTPAMAQLETSSFNGTTWSAGKPLLISNSATTCANEALNVTDIYAAASNLFYVTVFVQAGGGGGGGANLTGVAVWNGNTTATCAGINNLGGVAYTDTTVDAAAFQSTINAPTFALRAIHGTSSTHMLAGGDNGTLTAFDDGKWTTQSPTTPLSAPTSWGTNYSVRSVYLAGNDGWVAGTVDVPGTTTCRSIFVMHGTFGTSWTWDKIVATTADVTTCSNTTGTRARTALNKVWVDSTTGSVYLVGSTGTDNTGAIVSNGATQTREVALRVKMK